MPNWFGDFLARGVGFSSGSRVQKRKPKGSLRIWTMWTLKQKRRPSRDIGNVHQPGARKRPEKGQLGGWSGRSPLTGTSQFGWHAAICLSLLGQKYIHMYINIYIYIMSTLPLGHLQIENIFIKWKHRFHGRFPPLQLARSSRRQITGSE